MLTLIETIESLPQTPGIYKYYDKNDRLLYIGKAKRLKNRVKNYFQITDGVLSPSLENPQRTISMVSEIARMEYIVVPTENDALILEASQVKLLNPKYNILLRNDKVFPYIIYDTTDSFPRLERVKFKAKKKKDIKYYGPFVEGSTAIIEAIYELVPLVQKKSCLSGKKACLFHQIGKCMAPCEDLISIGDYQVLFNKALGYLENRTLLLKDIQTKMFDMAEQERFEEAAVYKGYMEKVKISMSEVKIDLGTNEDADFIAINDMGDKVFVSTLFVRNGRLVSTDRDIVHISGLGIDCEEVLRRVIVNAYSEGVPVDLKAIYTNVKVSDTDEIEEFLKKSLGSPVKIKTPITGKKKELLDVAIANTLVHIKTSLSRDVAVLGQLRDFFNLDKFPDKIEVFDNSHHSGEFAVGAMIIYQDGKFERSLCRKYHLSGKDEYSQMTELLTRRISSFEKDGAPSLWVLDGGDTLVALAEKLLTESGRSIPVIGIAKEKDGVKSKRAKGKASDILYTSSDSFNLVSSHPVLLFLQRLRDEAHKNAIEFHRKIKTKKSTETAFLGVKGIGDAKIKKGIKYFGTFETMRAASLDDLIRVFGVVDGASIFKLIAENVRTAK